MSSDISYKSKANAVRLEARAKLRALSQERQLRRRAQAGPPVTQIEPAVRETDLGEDAFGADEPFAEADVDLPVGPVELSGLDNEAGQDPVRMEEDHHLHGEESPSTLDQSDRPDEVGLPEQTSQTPFDATTTLIADMPDPDGGSAPQASNDQSHALADQMGPPAPSPHSDAADVGLVDVPPPAPIHDEPPTTETFAASIPEDPEPESLSPPIGTSEKAINSDQSGDAVADMIPDASSPEACDLATLPGAGPGLIWMLQECGIHSLDDLAIADASSLRQRLGVVGHILNVQSWITFAQQVVSHRDVELEDRAG